jgi:hypothetical protein
MSSWSWRESVQLKKAAMAFLCGAANEAHWPTGKDGPILPPCYIHQRRAGSVPMTSFHYSSSPATTSIADSGDRFPAALIPVMDHAPKSAA